MAKRMLIDALHTEETRVVIADENQVYDFDFVSTAKKQLKGNIYLAKITRVEPSLQAAFVEYGGGKQGFLPFSEIHADYYQIPISDRRRLMEEAQAEEERDEAAQQDGSANTASETSEPATQEGAIASTEFSGSSEVIDPDSIQLAEVDANEEQSHPAYLVQGAIDISTSEEVPEPHDELPISALVIENETSVESNAQEAQSEPQEYQPQDQQATDSQAAEGVETLPNEEEEYQARPKKNVFMKRYKIQEVIRRGQIVLVQVIKEERGNKGCSLTTYLSLAGRYCVLMPNSPKDGGISRKIASADDRKRLKAISTEMRLADGMSVIIRTAGMDRTRAEIKRDYDYLVKLWNQIREDTLKSNAPALIYEESDIIKRAIRDQYTNDIDELVVEGDEGYNAAKEFMKLLLPSHTPKIKHHQEATPLFYAYGIEEQLLSMHDPIVKLRSGGYIVINPTEALISIDVNSGRSTGERNIEETAAKTNLEAAVEVARQLRLRDLAGLIVIDFIDMLESRNRRAVEKAMKDSLKADRAKIQLGRISPFGLMEMSRQRLRPSISESNMVQCPHCEGRGFIRSNESMSIQMIRSLEKEASAGVWSSLRLIAPQGVALHLLNNKRDVLRGIEQRYNLSVQVLIGPELTSSEFNLEKMRRSGSNDRPERAPEERNDRERRPRRDRNDRDRNDRDRERPRPVEAAPSEEAGNDNFGGSDNIEMMETPREDGFTTDVNGRKNRSRRRRGGRNRDRGERGERPAPVAAEGETPNQESFVENASGEATPAQPPREGSGRPPRQRGGRNRRPWRERDDRTPREGNEQVSQAPAREGDGNTLPAFATEERLPPPPAQPSAQILPMDTPSNASNAPAKKGWWKKMIELDD